MATAKTSKSVDKFSQETAPSMKCSPKTRQTTNFFENESITLRLKIWGSPAPKITWKFNGKNISQNRRVSIRKQGSFLTLHINRSKISDAGIYSVNLSNVCGNNTKSFHVHVIPKNPAYGKQNV